MIAEALDRFNQEDEDEQRRLQDEREDPGGPGGAVLDAVGATPLQVALVATMVVLVYKTDMAAGSPGVAAGGI